MTKLRLGDIRDEAKAQMEIKGTRHTDVKMGDVRHKGQIVVRLDDSEARALHIGRSTRLVIQAFFWFTVLGATAILFMFVARGVSPLILPLVLAASIATYVILAVLIMRVSGGLSEQSFVALVKASFSLLRGPYKQE